MIIERAYVEITNICNLNCRSCYNRSGLNHTRCELSYEEFARLADRLTDEFGCNHITLSGGEPTLHRDFETLLDKLYSLPISVSIVTNGTTNCKRICDEYNNGRLAIQLSLDGSTDEINAETRGSGNFEKTVRFLEKLEKPSIKSKAFDSADVETTSGKEMCKPSPVLKMVVSQKNIDDVEAFFGFALSHDCIPNYDFIAPIGNAGDKWNSLDLSAKQKLRVLREINQLNKKYGVNISLPLCTSTCPLSNPDTKISALIKSNGDIHPCQMLYNEKYKLGNILTDKKEAITERMAEITAIAAKREQTDFGCNRCLARQFCKGGCMAFADMRSGDLLANDGDCEYRKFQLVGFSAIEQGMIK